MGMIVWLMPSLLAFSVDDGAYTCVQTQVQMEQRKKEALQKTLDATNFMIRGMAESRLEGKPYMCRRYLLESLSGALRVTCDKRPVIDIKLDGTPTFYPTQNGGFTSVADIEPQKIVQKFDAGNGGFSVVYQKTDIGFDVIKTIYSSYLGVPLKVHASYVRTDKEQEKP